MNDSAFFDTNIIVYAYDESEKTKREIAVKLVENVFIGNNKGAISNQVLAELFTVLTEKMSRPLGKNVASEIIRKYVLSEKWEKIDYTSSTALKASLSSSLYRTPFWDALIAETMKENGISRILTENERDFEHISEIKTINPFK